MGDGPFQSLTAPPAISYATEEVQPPTALATTTNDQLVVKVHNSNAAPGLRVFLRILLPDGTISPSDFPIVPDATRAVNTFAFPMVEGFILSAVVFTTATNLFRGQCYVRLLVFRGSLTQSFAGHMLCEGYVTTATALSFPNGPNSYATDGRGVIRSITGTTPAAGAEISETVPTGARWRLISITARLTTDATVTTRTPVLFISDGTTNVSSVAAGTTIAQSNSLFFLWTQLMYVRGQYGNQSGSSLPFSEFLNAGFKFLTLTTNLQAADQWSLVQYLVEEWINI